MDCLGIFLVPTWPYFTSQIYIKSHSTMLKMLLTGLMLVKNLNPLMVIEGLLTFNIKANRISQEGSYIIFWYSHIFFCILVFLIPFFIPDEYTLY